MISGSGPSPQAPGLRLRLARGRATGAGPGPQAGLPVQWPSHGTGPHSMHGVMPASYPGGVCDTVDLSLGQEARYSTSIRGPWSFPLTILQIENQISSMRLLQRQIVVH